MLIPRFCFRKGVFLPQVRSINPPPHFCWIQLLVPNFKRRVEIRKSESLEGLIKFLLEIFAWMGVYYVPSQIS